MNEKIEKAYTPKEVFTTLDIGDSTLRKWCLALEKNGYEFIRNDKNSRIYVEGDLVVLRHFQNLVKENMPLDNAAKLVVDRFGKGAFEVSTASVPVEKQEERHEFDRSNEDIKELKGLVEKQNELIKELISRMDQQQKYIDERLEQRDRKLMESLRESQEERKALLQLAAAQEEEKKKGFFSKIFRR